MSRCRWRCAAWRWPRRGAPAPRPRRAWDRCGGSPARGLAAAPGPGRLTKHLLPSLPADVVAFAVAGYLWLLLPMNLLYPLRLAVYDESARDSWGGPTLAGAWAVHAAGGVAVFVLVGLPIAAGLAWVQAWIAHRTLAGPA